MVHRYEHVGKSGDEINQYAKKIKSAKGEKTIPEVDLDASSVSTPELEKEIEKVESRPRSVLKRIYEKIDWGWTILISIILILFTLYANLNKDMGKIEERTKDIPVLREKLISIDKRIEIIALEIKKSYEFVNYRLEEVNNKFKKIEGKKEN